MQNAKEEEVEIVEKLGESQFRPFHPENGIS